jgi:flavodoxin
MKIGIIVYSQTGNTSSVALKIQEALIKNGHSVDIEKIEAIRDEKQPALNIKLTKTPNVEKYDGIIFATFVEAFCLCPVMDKYLKQLKSLKDKKVALFVTQFFPYPWMGGNHAIKQMKKIVS